jgi:glutathione S-transferase
MKLFGGYGSPFTRRVGVTLLMYKLEFEHVALRSSIPEELEELKRLNPLARVPALQTDEGMVFVDSATILDHLDQLKGTEGQLMPATGLFRTKMLNLIGIAAGAAEKSVACYYEEGINAKRPADKVYRPWVDRMYEQTKDALDALENMVEGSWMMGNSITQADISVVCFWDFIIKNRPPTAPKIECPKLEEISKVSNAMKEFSATIPA